MEVSCVHSDEKLVITVSFNGFTSLGCFSTDASAALGGSENMAVASKELWGRQ